LTRKRARKKERKRERRKWEGNESRERADKCDNKQTPHSTTQPKKEKKRKKEKRKEKKRKEEAERKQSPKLHDGCFWLPRWLGHESRLDVQGMNNPPPDFIFFIRGEISPNGDFCFK